MSLWSMAFPDLRSYKDALKLANQIAQGKSKGLQSYQQISVAKFLFIASGRMHPFAGAPLGSYNCVGSSR